MNEENVKKLVEQLKEEIAGKPEENNSSEENTSEEKELFDILCEHYWEARKALGKFISERKSNINPYKFMIAFGETVVHVEKKAYEDAKSKAKVIMNTVIEATDGDTDMIDKILEML